MIEGKIWYEEENKSILIDAGVILHAEPEEEYGGYWQACSMTPQVLESLQCYLTEIDRIFVWVVYNNLNK